MANQIIGTIVYISPLQSLTTKSGTPFTKRDLVISIQKFDPNTGQPYSDQSNTPQITFMGDKCQELDRFQPGQMVCVSFDLSGRQYTGSDNQTKIINDVRGYKIEEYRPYGQAPANPPIPVADLIPPAETFTPQEAQNNPIPPQPATSPKKDDGLPF